MKLATGIALTALVLLAGALYLHGSPSGRDVTAAPDRLGAGANTLPGITAPDAARVARVEEQLRDAGAQAASKEQADPFGDAHQAAAALALATNDPNVTRTTMGNLVMTLETAVSAARTQAKTPAQAQMVGFYADALVAYRDGLQFWELRRFADRPGQNGELDTLAAKYAIQPVKAISYTATWQKYPDAYLKIWAVANASTTKGNELYSR